LLEALEQAESALVARQTIATQREARLVAADSSARALEQARALYREGRTDFGDVLKAQRSWLGSRMEVVETDAARARAAIALFEAVGVIGA